MKMKLDIHVHTIASGHAYSTLSEYVAQAKKLGLELIAQTDHGPSMPGGPHAFHIANQKIIPDVIDGVRVLKGVEANIMDYEGKLDLDERYLKSLDIVIASLHDVCLEPGTVEENTKALIGAVKNPYVDVIGHSGNPRYPIDIETFVKAVKEYDKIIEINNSSFKKSRVGSRPNCEQIAEMANRYGVKLLATTDSHIHYDLGQFEHVEDVFERVGVAEDLIMGTSSNKLLEHLRKHGKAV